MDVQMLECTYRRMCRRVDVQKCRQLTLLTQVRIRSNSVLGNNGKEKSGLERVGEERITKERRGKQQEMSCSSDRSLDIMADKNISYVFIPLFMSTSHLIGTCVLNTVPSPRFSMPSLVKRTHVCEEPKRDTSRSRKKGKKRILFQHDLAYF